jgi:hypothetical protein
MGSAQYTYTEQRYAHCTEHSTPGVYPMIKNKRKKDLVVQYKLINFLFL